MLRKRWRTFESRWACWGALSQTDSGWVTHLRVDFRDRAGFRRSHLGKWHLSAVFFLSRPRSERWGGLRGLPRLISLQRWEELGSGRTKRWRFDLRRRAESRRLLPLSFLLASFAEFLLRHPRSSEKDSLRAGLPQKRRNARRPQRRLPRQFPLRFDSAPVRPPDRRLQVNPT